MNEINIWVDTWGSIIGHARLIGALQSTGHPGRAFVKWKQKGASRLGDVGLDYYYAQVQEKQNIFKLFGVGEAAWGAYHFEHNLKDLDLQPNLAGIIIVTEKDLVDHLHNQLEEMSETGSPFSEDWFLSWIKKQNIPFIFAATGYESSRDELEKLRTDLGLDSSIPLIPGPSIYQNEKVNFDSKYARKVLMTLAEFIK
jgi:hypothetical protein